MKSVATICAGLALAIAPALAGAQQKARPDPIDAKAAVPKVVYASPLKDYRPIGDDQVGSWKSANEEVDKAGGWKAYLREGQQPPPPVPVQSKPVAPQGHAGH